MAVVASTLPANRHYQPSNQPPTPHHLPLPRLLLPRTPPTLLPSFLSLRCWAGLIEHLHGDKEREREKTLHNDRPRFIEEGEGESLKPKSWSMNTSCSFKRTTAGFPTAVDDDKRGKTEPCGTAFTSASAFFKKSLALPQALEIMVHGRGARKAEAGRR